MVTRYTLYIKVIAIIIIIVFSLFQIMNIMYMYFKTVFLYDFTATILSMVYRKTSFLRPVRHLACCCMKTCFPALWFQVSHNGKGAHVLFHLE